MQIMIICDLLCIYATKMDHSITQHVYHSAVNGNIVYRIYWFKHWL